MADCSDNTRVLRLLQQRPLFVLLAISLPIVEYLARESGGPGPSIAIVRNPFAAIAAATVFCRYLLCNSLRLSRNWTVYAMPVAIVVGLASAPPNVPVQILSMHAMVAIGVLGALGFIVAAIRSEDPRDTARIMGQLLDALLLPVAASMVSFGLWSTGRVNPVYDGRVYAFEEILGPRLSLLGVRSYQLLAPLSRVATACYGMVALGIVLVAAAQKTVRRETAVLNAAVIAGACGFALYFICPVVGPLHVFGPMYPHALPPLPTGAPVMIAAVGPPRNGMPSLHTVWALLIWFNAQSLPVTFRRAARLFVILTLWAAMGLEDSHWFMDVVVGVPLAVAIQSAVVTDEQGRRRWASVIVGGMLTAVWLIGFRIANPLLMFSTLGAWLAVLVTVSWPLRRWFVEGGGREVPSPHHPGPVRIRKPMSQNVTVRAEP